MTRLLFFLLTSALLLPGAVPASAASFSSTRDLQCSTANVDGAISSAAESVLQDALTHLRSLAGDAAPDDDLVNLLSGTLRMRIDVTNVYKNGRTPCPTVTVTGAVPATVEEQAAALMAQPAPQQAEQADAAASGPTAQAETPEITPLTARTYFEPQDWNLELQKATLAVATDKNNPTAHAEQAVALLRLGRPVEALEAVNKALKLDANNPEGLYARGLVYTHYGQYPKAAEDFSEAIALRPDDTRAYVQRGIVFKSMSRFDEAVQDFDRALLASPGDVSVYTNRAIAYAGLDRMDMAVSDLTNAVQLSPSDPWPYIYRGLAFYQTGEYRLMCQDFDKAHYRGKPEGTEWAKRKGLCD